MARLSAGTRRDPVDIDDQSSCSEEWDAEESSRQAVRERARADFADEAREAYARAPWNNRSRQARKVDFLMHQLFLARGPRSSTSTYLRAEVAAALEAVGDVGAAAVRLVDQGVLPHGHNWKEQSCGVHELRERRAVPKAVAAGLLEIMRQLDLSAAPKGKRGLQLQRRRARSSSTSLARLSDVSSPPASVAGLSSSDRNTSPKRPTRQVRFSEEPIARVSVSRSAESSPASLSSAKPAKHTRQPPLSPAKPVKHIRPPSLSPVKHVQHTRPLPLSPARPALRTPARTRTTSPAATPTPVKEQHTPVPQPSTGGRASAMTGQSPAGATAATPIDIDEPNCALESAPTVHSGCSGPTPPRALSRPGRLRRSPFVRAAAASQGVSPTAVSCQAKSPPAQPPQSAGAAPFVAEQDVPMQTEEGDALGTLCDAAPTRPRRRRPRVSMMSAGDDPFELPPSSRKRARPPSAHLCEENLLSHSLEEEDGKDKVECWIGGLSPTMDAGLAATPRAQRTALKQLPNGSSRRKSGGDMCTPVRKPEMRGSLGSKRRRVCKYSWDDLDEIDRQCLSSDF